MIRSDRNLVCEDIWPSGIYEQSFRSITPVVMEGRGTTRDRKRSKIKLPWLDSNHRSWIASPMPPLLFVKKVWFWNLENIFEIVYEFWCEGGHYLICQQVHFCLRGLTHQKIDLRIRGIKSSVLSNMIHQIYLAWLRVGSWAKKNTMQISHSVTLSHNPPGQENCADYTQQAYDDHLKSIHYCFIGITHYDTTQFWCELWSFLCVRVVGNIYWGSAQIGGWGLLHV
jgi:hypothetical protein